MPTWNADKGRESEVINILSVLKKKYVDGIFERYKSRAVFDGAEQKRKYAGNALLDCFAPTVRHSTHKLLVAHACVQGGKATKLSV